MASQTPNIGLTLPIGSENVSRQIINENNTKIDAAIAGKAGKELLGYKEDGDTASQAIADGSFVVWKGNLYKANGSISQGTAFSNSNLTAVTDGGFNDLKSSVDSLSDSLATVGTWTGVTLTLPANSGSVSAYKNDKAKIAVISYNSGANTNIDTQITLPESMAPLFDVVYSAVRGNGYLRVNANGRAFYINCPQSYCPGQIVFPIA